MKSIAFTIMSIFMIFGFSSCSSQKKLQEKAPVQLQEAYCMTWVSGVRGGGAGMNIFIPVTKAVETDIKLDSVYFRGKSAKLETKPQNESLYIGRFKSDANKGYDIVINGDTKQEYGNKMPETNKNFPFDLNNDECVVSYKVGSKTKYFKIGNVVEKKPTEYPMAPKQ